MVFPSFPKVWRCSYGFRISKLLPFPGHTATGDGRGEGRRPRRRQLSEEPQGSGGGGGTALGASGVGKRWAHWGDEVRLRSGS